MERLSMETIAKIFGARIKEKLYEIAVELDLDFEDPEVLIGQNFMEDSYAIKTSIKANRLYKPTPR